MYDIVFTGRMKRDVKLMKKRRKNIDLLVDILDRLSKGETLPEFNKDHQLKGEWKDFRECHIEPDWLLIYEINDGILVLMLYRVGSHSELF